MCHNCPTKVKLAIRTSSSSAQESLFIPEDIDVRGDGVTKLVANSETELAQAMEALENYHRGEQNSGSVTYIIVPRGADTTADVERLLREGRQAGLRVVVLAGDTALTPAEAGVLLPHLVETINLG